MLRALILLHPQADAAMLRPGSPPQASSTPKAECPCLFVFGSPEVSAACRIQLPARHNNRAGLEVHCPALLELSEVYQPRVIEVRIDFFGRRSLLSTSWRPAPPWVMKIAEAPRGRVPKNLLLAMRPFKNHAKSWAQRTPLNQRVLRPVAHVGFHNGLLSPYCGPVKLTLCRSSIDVGEP